MSIECRICYTAESEAGPLLRLCSCRGSIAHAHHSCLQKWIESSGQEACPICQASYCGSHRLKPPAEWQWPLLEPIVFLPIILVLTLPLLKFKISFENQILLLVCIGMLTAEFSAVFGKTFWMWNRTFVLEEREAGREDSVDHE